MAPVALVRGHAPVARGLTGSAPPRLLIVNCDDFGMYDGINVAVIDSIDRGIAGLVQRDGALSRRGGTPCACCVRVRTSRSGSI